MLASLLHSFTIDTMHSILAYIRPAFLHCFYDRSHFLAGLSSANHAYACLKRTLCDATDYTLNAKP